MTRVSDSIARVAQAFTVRRYDQLVDCKVSGANFHALRIEPTLKRVAWLVNQWRGERYNSMRFDNALCIVTSSAYSRSDPTGTPIAIRVIRMPKGFSSFVK